MNWLKLIELPLKEYALAHYREALRLSGVKDRSQVGNMLRKDFPNGGLSDCLRELTSLPLNEIGLFFFYLGCVRISEERSGLFKHKSEIHELYAQQFHSHAPSDCEIINRRRYYRLLEKSFTPLSESMTTTDQSSEWRVYLDLCMGREQMAA